MTTTRTAAMNEGAIESMRNRPRQVARPWWLVVCIGLVALAATACSSDGSASEVSVPDGYVEVQAGPARWAQPDDWAEVPEGERAHEGVYAQYEAPQAGEGTPTTVFVFLDDVSSRHEHTARVSSLVGRLRTSFSDFELEDEREIDVPGGDQATLLEWTYTTDAGEPARTFDVLTDDGEQTVTLRIGGLEGSLDEDTARRIIDSLVLA